MEGEQGLIGQKDRHKEPVGRNRFKGEPGEPVWGTAGKKKDSLLVKVIESRPREIASFLANREGKEFLCAAVLRSVTCCLSLTFSFTDYSQTNSMQESFCSI